MERSVAGKAIAMLVVVGLLLNLSSANAQTIVHECSTQATEATIEYYSKIREEIVGTKSDIGMNSLPLSLHIIRDNNGSGGLTNAEITTMLADLNATFLSAQIEFFLPTSVNYIDSDTYYEFGSWEESSLTNAYNVPNTVNIYIPNTVQSNSGTYICGYTHFPGEAGEHVIVSSACVFNGSTLAHEVGHFFGLYHTHGKTNGGNTDELATGNNCIFSGDDICDTDADPNIFGNVDTNCNYIGNAIDENGMPYQPDPSNLMSYAPASCRDFISSGQAERMHYFLQNERSNIASNVLSATFSADVTNSVCGQTLTTQFTYTGTGATSYQWDVDGDGTTDYTSQNPTHTYTQAGVYSVILTVGSGSLSVTRTEAHLVKVQSVETNTYQEDFQNGLQNWVLDNPDNGNEWMDILDFAYSNDNVICINNYEGNSSGEMDIMRSPSIDLSTMTNPELNFDLSYMPYYLSQSLFFSDRLEVQISTDCGATYSTIYDKTGTNLSTTTQQTAARWYPQTTNDWRTETVDLSAYAGQIIHVRFINHSAQGNYLYLDNIGVQSSAALPLELIDFQAIAENKNENNLTWTTAFEENVETFYVEYATNGNEFEAIEKVDAIGHSTSSNNYQYTHETTALTAYYRLKIMDMDGTISYSPIRFAQKEDTGTIRVVQNPVVNELILENTGTTTPIAYTLYNNYGQKMGSGSAEHSTISRMNVEQLPAGVYLLHWTQDGKQAVQKIMVND